MSQIKLYDNNAYSVIDNLCSLCIQKHFNIFFKVTRSMLPLRVNNIDRVNFCLYAVSKKYEVVQ